MLSKGAIARTQKAVENDWNYHRATRLSMSGEELPLKPDSGAITKAVDEEKDQIAKLFISRGLTVP